jgi:hypothetical protein
MVGTVDRPARLIKRIACRMQANHKGGLIERARNHPRDRHPYQRIDFVVVCQVDRLSRSLAEQNENLKICVQMSDSAVISKTTVALCDMLSYSEGAEQTARELPGADQGGL